MNELFRRFSAAIAHGAGSPTAFFLAVASIAVWAVMGPLFDYSDTWQLAINTATTIVTFLIVFLIQNTQNRDAKAIHLKLDELIRVLHGARDSLVDLESLTDAELEALHHEFQRVRQRAAARLRQRERPEGAAPSSTRRASHGDATRANP